MLLSLLASISLTGCSGSDVLKGLLGGGPNVAANVQAGKTNSQTIGQSGIDERKTIVRPRARVDKVDQSTNTTVNVPFWAVLVMICLAAGGAIGWVDNILRLFKRKKKRKWMFNSSRSDKL